ncbi:unnamed protein product [Urochloa decumbens]|uniref:Uncharacterized protein n=1 Tax=Urochloa decumbens TaxID=240449 RepID=A0ABC9BH09_9POAL
MQSWKGKGYQEGTKMSKREKDGHPYGLKEKPQHLILVLDDWSRGYCIRKIDLSFGDPGPQQKLHAGVEHDNPRLHSLPSSSFKFEAPRGYPRYFAGAFGSNVLAMQPTVSKFKNDSMNGILIYDVCKRSIIIGPPQRPDPVDPIYIPVGGRLFALAARSFQLLDPPPYDDTGSKNLRWRWHTLPEPPFLHLLVTSYAVHRSGQTIFVSIGGQAPATFSFDTVESEMDGRWKHLGQWKMPFSGRGHFAPELNSWVGLWGALGSHRICAIDVVSDNPVLKLCEEGPNLSEDELIGATLVSMGGGSKFCLLEYKYNNEEKVVMQLTTFSLKYNKNGNLTMGKSRQIQRYRVAEEVTESMLRTPVAFCM